MWRRNERGWIGRKRSWRGRKRYWLRRRKSKCVLHALSTGTDVWGIGSGDSTRSTCLLRRHCEIGQPPSRLAMLTTFENSTSCSAQMSTVSTVYSSCEDALTMSRRRLLYRTRSWIWDDQRTSTGSTARDTGAYPFLPLDDSSLILYVYRWNGRRSMLHGVIRYSSSRRLRESSTSPSRRTSSSLFHDHQY